MKQEKIGNTRAVSAQTNDEGPNHSASTWNRMPVVFSSILSSFSLCSPSLFSANIIISLKRILKTYSRDTIAFPKETF